MTPQPTPLEVADCTQLGAVATTLMKLQQKQRAETLVITSCNAREGKTTVTIQLALAAITQAGFRVLLIDFNPKNPVLASLFNVDSSPGISEYLDSTATTREVIKATSVTGLDLVTSGNSSSSRLRRYDPTNLKDKISALRVGNGQPYDLVLMDGPSSFNEPDLALSGMVFDGVILVIECERTRWEVVKNYQARLQDGRANLIGAVLNKRRYYIPRGLYV